LFRILIVDDEPDVVASMKVGLERKGYSVDSYTSPEEALAHYSRGAYELLILDIRMPQIDGFELLRRIRKIDPDVKVHFLTAYDVSKEEFSKALPDVDYSALLQKPLMIEQLAGIIKNTLASISGPGGNGLGHQ
jgi:CheY-like chemotaxis protein